MPTAEVWGERLDEVLACEVDASIGKDVEAATVVALMANDFPRGIRKTLGGSCSRPVLRLGALVMESEAKAKQR